MSETKSCRKCGESKPVEEFHKAGGPYKGKQYYYPECKQCVNKTPRRTTTQRKCPPETTTKICKRCGEEKPKTEWPGYGATTNLGPLCRPCLNAATVENRAARRAADPLRYVCRRCDETKAPDDFMPTKNGGRSRLCRECHRRDSVATNAKKVAALPKTKTCCDCGETKSREDFPHFGRIPAPRCKPCFRVWENAKRAREREDAPRKNYFFRPYVDEASGLLVKKCTRCKVVKPVDTEFGRRESIKPRLTARRSGDQYVRATCMECEREQALVRIHADPEKTRKIARARVERIRNAPRVEEIDRMAIIRRDNCTCYLCGKVLLLSTRYPHPESIVLDHVIPLTRGGSHTADNLRVACSRCNNRKKQRLLSELSWYKPVSIGRDL